MFLETVWDWIVLDCPAGLVLDYKMYMYIRSIYISSMYMPLSIAARQSKIPRRSL